MTKYEPDLSRLFHALSDPTRRAIMVQLGAGPQPMAKLAEPSGFALPTIQRHLAVLEEAGLITTQKQGRQRICTARADGLDGATQWIKDTRTKMAAQTDRLSHYLDQLIRKSDDL
jgi:DNA-binding transcriptional ArsR family regulator